MSFNSSFTDSLVFFTNFTKKSKQIGSIIPSSKDLAKKLSSKVKKESSKPKNILEVGSGTGSITEELVKILDKNDNLVLVELDKEFCEVLKNKIKKWESSENCPNIKLFEGNILDLDEIDSFDNIICCLPFNSFPIELTTQIFQKFKKLLLNKGYVSYFEYMGGKKVLYYIMNEKEKVKKIMKYYDENIEKFVKDLDKSYFNIPPALVRHLQFD